MSRKLFRLVVTGVGLPGKLRKHGGPILSGDHSGEPPVEPRMGASTDAKRRSVSHPRSSNRTCGFPASGFPTGFIVGHTEQSTDRKRHLRSVLFLRHTI